MEKHEQELISQWITKDPELRKCVEEHQAFERQLEAYEQKPYLTTEEETEVKQIKKLKLRSKDRIEAILTHYRKQRTE
ncbi:MAG TPA: YdcH family protein [Thermodesulfobacteriota bacterium]|nr:YdcH family protein [Deltaproteobacteria bacterium]HNR12968.1 YdcH family protein [Thermodesulfobacteriota bacterium]HNU71733.1 YdcH family protein [Thermodesulfobacteriota bacterium]HOC37717.1 YdcH family protein [Thermodesulfobacteriota bacterium]HQO77906.1 YdcH family protein [Thermodesulfobacteriota bacterium]